MDEDLHHYRHTPGGDQDVACGAACERQEGSDWFVLHTGQHYSYGMDRVFFEQPGLPDARHNPDVGAGSGGHGGQRARVAGVVTDNTNEMDYLYV